MPIYADPVQSSVSALSNLGRKLYQLSSLGKVVFEFHGWAAGRGGYDTTNPVKRTGIDPAATALIDKVWPATGYALINEEMIERPNFRAVSFICRIDWDDEHNALGPANWGYGEIGIWAKVLKSTVPDFNVGDLVLYAVSHFPLKSKAYNGDAIVFRVPVQL